MMAAAPACGLVWAVEVCEPRSSSSCRTGGEGAHRQAPQICRAMAAAVLCGRVPTECFSTRGAAPAHVCEQQRGALSLEKGRQRGGQGLRVGAPNPMVL